VAFGPFVSLGRGRGERHGHPGVRKGASTARSGVRGVQPSTGRWKVSQANVRADAAEQAASRIIVQAIPARSLQPPASRVRDARERLGMRPDVGRSQGPQRPNSQGSPEEVSAIRDGATEADARPGPSFPVEGP
jgi:hypothetical protein